MLQGSLRVGMPEVTLHVLNAGVVLNVCRRRTPECLMRHVADAGLFSQRLQMPLQIISDTKCASGRTWEEESAGIMTVRMPHDPGFDFALEARRHRNEIVALIRFCVANPVLSA